MEEPNTDQQPQKAGHREERSEPDHPHGLPPARHSTSEVEDERDKDDAVEEASRDSYPGSDAPAW